MRSDSAQSRRARWLFRDVRREAQYAAISSERGSRVAEVTVAAALYQDRNTVERLINKMKAWRGVATRYDKTPDSYLTRLQLRDRSSGSAAPSRRVITTPHMP